MYNVKFRKQDSLSSCGPYSIYNFAKIYNKTLNLTSLKKECKTDKDGTFVSDFEKTLKKYFRNIKKSYLNINQIKSLCNKKPLIIGYEYYLSSGEIEGHFALIIGYKNKKFLMVNNYSLRDVNKIDSKNRNKLFKTTHWVSEKVFKEKFINKNFYYLKGDF